MVASPFSRHGFMFFLFLAISTIAVLERFAQVAAPKLGLLEYNLLLTLVVTYLVYLSIARHVLVRLWGCANTLPAAALFLVGWAVLTIIFA